MSWDIVIFNSTQQITSIEELDEEQLVAIDFDAILQAFFLKIKIDDTHRSIEGTDFSIDYFINDEPVSNKLFRLYGENALFKLIPLSKSNNWQIFDMGLGEMIDLENPEKNGFDNFQNYLKHILNKNPE
jgi:hypothetical protein